MIRISAAFLAAALCAGTPALAEPQAESAGQPQPVVLLPVIGAAAASESAQLPAPQTQAPAVTPAETLRVPAKAGSRCAQRQDVTS